MQYDAIPSELKQLAQWVCVGAEKIPINPFTGGAASVTDPNTWSTFDVAVQRANGHGIGFVFTDADPYSFIDLDAPKNEEQSQRHASIYQTFNSYTELSRSGNGVHIIVRGKVPHGMRREKVEVYSNARYAIMTGRVLKPLPINDCQNLLNGMLSQMQPTGAGAELVQREGLFGDQQIIDMASRAANGDKFMRLAQGNWEGMGYPSQSEADFALMSIIAFYTPDNEQCRRIFRGSVLGRRAKATRNDKYLNYALAKIRGNEPPKIDLSKICFQTTAAAAAEPTGTGQLDLGVMPAQEATAPAALTLPEGLMGEVADYIYRSAPHPLPEAAIAGAMAMMAGICGRSYNISKTGLNLYVMLIAETGIGKESASSGIDAIFSHVRRTVPNIYDFIGPAVFGSGQALLKMLPKKPSFFSILDEFGLTLQQLSDPHASSAETMMRRVLLSLYSKSGQGRRLGEMIYSDSDKNTGDVNSPALTILGESTPLRFYEGLDVGSIEEGLLPRFLMLEHVGDGESRNRAAGYPPPAIVVKQVADLAASSMAMAANGAVLQVQLDAPAQAIFDAFEIDCAINRKGSIRGADKDLWSRSYLKALKLAALIAVGCNMYAPVINAKAAEWAVALVVRGTQSLITRFNTGAYGKGDIRQEAEVRAAITRYVNMTKAQRLNAKCPQDCVAHNLIPFAYLRDQLRRKVAFQHSRMGLVRAIDVAILDAVQAGILVPLSGTQLMALGIRNKCWALGEG